MYRSLIAAAAAILTAGAAHAGVVTKAVDYEYGGVKLKGFLAYDDAQTGKKPGVVVFPEWWGLNDYAKTRAKQLAELGYVAFAADLYGNGKVIDIAHPNDAKEMATYLRSHQDVWRARAKAAFDQLSGRPNVDASRVAAIGYCLGGSTALQLAFTGADLRAVTTFHAGMPMTTPADAAAVKAKVLVCHGGADPAVSMDAVNAFKAALTAAKKPVEVVVYPGVVHSFTSPDADKVGSPAMKYNKEADEDSWRRMSELFRRELGS